MNSQFPSQILRQISLYKLLFRKSILHSRHLTEVTWKTLSVKIPSFKNTPKHALQNALISHVKVRPFPLLLQQRNYKQGRFEQASKLDEEDEDSEEIEESDEPDAEAQNELVENTYYNEVECETKRLPEIPNLPIPKSNGGYVVDGVVLKDSPKLGFPQKRTGTDMYPPREYVLPELPPLRMDDVRHYGHKIKKLPTFNTSIHHKSYHTWMIQSKRGYAKKRKQNKKDKCKLGTQVDCEHKQQSCAAACRKYFVKPCKPVYRKTCVREHPPCKKINSPYKAFSECVGDKFAPELSECEDYFQKILQPKNQVPPNLDLVIQKVPPPKLW